MNKKHIPIQFKLIIATIFMLLAAGGIVVELIIQQYHGILVLALFFFANALVFVAKSTREVWLFCPLATFLVCYNQTMKFNQILSQPK